MKRRALISWGGYEGHEPEKVADIFRSLLEKEGFEVEVTHDLNRFAPDVLSDLSLIVPVWTMGDISSAQLDAVTRAVESGVGIAGCHGGLCDAFRTAQAWHFMAGGQWVAHPGDDGVRYRVQIADARHPVTEGIRDFDVETEQYYLHVDPAVKVLATTRFPTVDGPHTSNGPVDMPVIWTKHYGKGRVFYNSLGHNAAVITSEPCLTLIRRGFLWAAR